VVANPEYVEGKKRILQGCGKGEKEKKRGRWMNPPPTKQDLGRKGKKQQERKR
jgi:hypothetical protein